MSAFLRRFDPYTLAGVLVLAAASAILVLLMVSSRVVIFSNQPLYYSIAILMVIATPIALLALMLLSDLLAARPSRLLLPVLRKRRNAEERQDLGGIETFEKAEGGGILEVSVGGGRGSEGEARTPGGAVTSEPATNMLQTPGDPTAMGRGPTAGISVQDVGSLVRDEIAKAASDITATVKRISDEVEAIKKQFEEIKSSIEEGMMDVRALLSEISNPFNYMRRFMTEPELSEMGIRVEGGKDLGAQHSAGERPGRDGRDSRDAAAPEHDVEAPVARAVDSSNNIGKGLAELLSGEASVAKLMRLIIFVGDWLPELGREGLIGLVELGVTSGVLPKDSMHLVAKVISLIEGSKIPPRKLAVTLYELARSMGVGDKEAEFLSAALSGV